MKVIGALCLYELNGSVTNVLAQCNRNFEDTVLMAQCPYIMSVIGLFVSASIYLNLMPEAIIKDHRYSGLVFEQGEARIHIPVTTNSQA
jgi:hypothetical protein